MGNKKLELDIDDEMLDFLLREGIRTKIKSEFSDKKIMVLPPEWAGMIEDNDSAIADTTDTELLSYQEIKNEDEAIEYFVGLGLESILKDRFNSIEEEFSVNENAGVISGISIH